MGNYYGDAGRSTFTFPDLRRRTPIHWGQGPGLPNYQGETGDGQWILPFEHDAEGMQDSGPQGPAAASTRGPFLALNFAIALEGVFPARD